MLTGCHLDRHKLKQEVLVQSPNSTRNERFSPAKFYADKNSSSPSFIVWKLLLFNAHQCTLLGLDIDFEPALVQRFVAVTVPESH